MRRRVLSTRISATLGSKSSLAKGIAKLSSGVAAAQLVSLLAYPLLTRIYGTEAFGILAVYSSIVGLAVMLSTLRYDMAVPLPKTGQEGLAVVTVGLYANLAAATVLGVVGVLRPSFFELVGSGKVPHYLILLVPLGVWLGGTYKTMRMWAVREKAYGVIAVTQVTQTVSASVFQLAAGLIRPTGPSLVAGQMLGSGAGIGSIYTRTIRARGFRFPHVYETIAAAKHYWKFAVLGAPAALLNSAAINLPALLISAFYGITVTGQFGLAMRVIGVPMSLLGSSVESAFYAEAARLGATNARRIRRLVDRLTIRLAALAILPVLVLVIGGPVLFGFVFGEEWTQAGRFASYLTVFMFFNILSMPFSSIFLIYNKLHYSLLLNLTKACLAVGAFVVPSSLGWDASGAMLTYALSLGFFYFTYGITARAVLGSALRRQATEQPGKSN